VSNAVWHFRDQEHAHIGEVGELTTYGVLLPDVELLWTAWWSLGTIGRAVAAYSHRWLEPNVAFLRKALSLESVRRILSLAVAELAGQPEHSVATLALEDFPLCEATVVARCAKLPQLLETTNEAGGVFEWPTQAS